MRSKALAILLIVLGVGATLGGLYGQIFLAEDDGHHDGRPPTFALESAVGAYELTVDAGGSTVSPVLSQAGQDVTDYGELHGVDGPHVFVVTEELDWFAHLTPPRLGEPIEVAGPARHRVVVQASLPGGPDLLEIAATTVEESGEPIDLSARFADGDVVVDAGTGLTITRQGFDFVLSEPWNGDDVYDGPAFLTLFRADDFSFSHAHAELVGTDRFSFATDLAGLGDYLAALEFEQDGELVTALFRFTL